MLLPLAPSKWLSSPRPNSAAPLRLWCFPFAGGGAATWHSWSAQLSASAEVVAVRLPGRENRLRETPLSTVDQLVSALANEVAPYSARPFVFCGHSFGALLAFEVARALRARGVPGPAGLIVSGARAPGTPRPEPDLHRLPDDQFAAEVDQRYGGIPAVVRANSEFLELFLPALRADLTAYETYRPTAEPKLELPLLALGGDDDRHVLPAELLAWQSHASGSFTSEFFPGGHFFLQTQAPNVIARVATFVRSIKSLSE